MPVTEATPSNWLKISQEWEESDLSQVEYCKSKGISRGYFIRQRTKLMAQGLIKPCYKQPKSKGKSRMSFIPMSLPLADVLPEPQKAESDFIEIQLPHGVVMRIPTC